LIPSILVYCFHTPRTQRHLNVMSSKKRIELGSPQSRMHGKPAMSTTLASPQAENSSVVQQDGSRAASWKEVLCPSFLILGVSFADNCIEYYNKCLTKIQPFIGPGERSISRLRTSLAQWHSTSTVRSRRGTGSDQAQGEGSLQRGNIYTL
jgi:hypothetical protein